jgi:hypothetical protein
MTKFHALIQAWRLCVISESPLAHFASEGLDPVPQEEPSMPPAVPK